MRKLCGTNVSKLLRNFEFFPGEFNVFLEMYLKLKFIYCFKRTLAYEVLLSRLWWSMLLTFRFTGPLDIIIRLGEKSNKLLLLKY